MIERLMKSTIPLEGEMAEIGVWKGYRSRVIHSKSPEKIFHLYDTFKGIVKADPEIDVHGNGEFSDTSVEEVSRFLGEKENIKFHVGIFPETFNELDKKFCFVFSDTDTFFGTKETLNNFEKLMVPGGKIVFHDYGWKGCPGVKKAIDQWIKNKSYKTELQGTFFSITF